MTLVLLKEEPVPYLYRNNNDIEYVYRFFHKIIPSVQVVLLSFEQKSHMNSA